MRSVIENYRSRRVLRDANAYLDDRRIELDHLRDKLSAAMESETSRKRRVQVRLAAALDAMSPLRVLTRGYCVATDEEGSVISGTDMLHIGSKLRLRLSDGCADCTVDGIEKEKNA